MKKRLCLMLAAAMLSALAGCSQEQKSNSQSEPEQSAELIGYSTSAMAGQDIDFTAQYIRTFGCYEEERGPRSMWFTSQTEFWNYVQPDSFGPLADLAGYDEQFFETYDLIAVVLEEPSGSIRHQVKAVQISPSNLDRVPYFIQPVIERITPEVCSWDIAKWHIFIAVGKEYGSGHSNLQEPIIEEYREERHYER